MILEELENKIENLEQKLKGKNNDEEIKKIKLMRSFIENPQLMLKCDIETIFGMLEFLGYDETNILNTYQKLILAIPYKNEYLIKKEKDDANERD